MKKLIAKTALITLGGLICLCLILWGMFSWLAPSVMVSVTDGLGMDSACVHYSISAYKKSGEIGDLARVVERSFLAEKYKIAAEYGAEFLEREDFSAYADGLGGSEYEQTVCGMTAVSLYYTGNPDEALLLAASYAEGKFSKTCGLAMLLNAAVSEKTYKNFEQEKDDREFVFEIRGAIESIELDSENAEGIAAREEALAVCDAFLK